MPCGDPQSCIIGCPCCGRYPCACSPWQPMQTYPSTNKLVSFMETGHTLTDADVERVARRVVELIGEKLK